MPNYGPLESKARNYYFVMQQANDGLQAIEHKDGRAAFGIAEQIRANNADLQKKLRNAQNLSQLANLFKQVRADAYEESKTLLGSNLDHVNGLQAQSECQMAAGDYSAALQSYTRIQEIIRDQKIFLELEFQIKFFIARCYLLSGQHAKVEDFYREESKQCSRSMLDKLLKIVPNVTYFAEHKKETLQMIDQARDLVYDNLRKAEALDKELRRLPDDKNKPKTVQELEGRKAALLMEAKHTITPLHKFFPTREELFKAKAACEFALGDMVSVRATCDEYIKTVRRRSPGGHGKEFIAIAFAVGLERKMENYPGAIQGYENLLDHPGMDIAWRVKILGYLSDCYAKVNDTWRSQRAREEVSEVINSQLKAAWRYIDKNEFREALSIVEPLAQLDRSDVQMVLARCYRGLRRYQDEFSCYQIVARDESKDNHLSAFKAALFSSQCMMNLKRPEEAAAFLKKAEKLSKTSEEKSWFFYMAEKHYRRLGLFSEADRMFLRMKDILREQRSGESHATRVAHVDLREDAIDQLHVQAAAYLAKANYGEAFHCYEDILQKDPANFRVRVEYVALSSRVYCRATDAKQAAATEAELKKLANDAKEQPYASLELARHYERNGKLNEAGAQYQATIRQFPRYIAPYQDFLRYCIAADSRESVAAGEKTAEHFLTLFPTDSKLHLYHLELVLKQAYFQKDITFQKFNQLRASYLQKFATDADFLSAVTMLHYFDYEKLQLAPSAASGEDDVEMGEATGAAAAEFALMGNEQSNAAVDAKDAAPPASASAAAEFPKDSESAADFSRASEDREEESVDVDADGDKSMAEVLPPASASASASAVAEPPKDSTPAALAVIPKSPNDKKEKSSGADSDMKDARPDASVSVAKSSKHLVAQMDDKSVGIVENIFACITTAVQYRSLLAKQLVTSITQSTGMITEYFQKFPNKWFGFLASNFSQGRANYFFTLLKDTGIFDLIFAPLILGKERHDVHSELKLNYIWLGYLFREIDRKVMRGGKMDMRVIYSLLIAKEAYRYRFEPSGRLERKIDLIMECYGFDVMPLDREFIYMCVRMAIRHRGHFIVDYHLKVAVEVQPSVEEAAIDNACRAFIEFTIMKTHAYFDRNEPKAALIELGIAKQAFARWQPVSEAQKNFRLQVLARKINLLEARSANSLHVSQSLWGRNAERPEPAAADSSPAKRPRI